MRNFNNSDYYLRRAEQERMLAATAANPDVRAIHRDMATRYALLAEQGAPPVPRPTLRLAF